MMLTAGLGVSEITIGCDKAALELGGVTPLLTTDAVDTPLRERKTPPPPTSDCVFNPSCRSDFSCGTTKKILNKNVKIKPFSLLLVSTSFYSHTNAFCRSGNTYHLAEYCSGCCALSAGLKGAVTDCK